MNILKHPEEALPGTVLSQKEFDDLAIEAGLVEDLMEESNLRPGEFTSHAIMRANARRTAQNLHLWAATANFSVVGLTCAESARVVTSLRGVLDEARKADQAIESLINRLVVT